MRNVFHDIKAEAFKPLVLGLLEYNQQGITAERLSDDKLIEILRTIRTYLIRRRILGLTQGENKNVVLLCDRVRKLSSGEVSMLELLSNQFYKMRLPNDVEVAERLKSLDFYNDIKKYSKFILGKIEENNTKVAVNFRDSKISIEHVMPQTLTNSWKEELGNEFETVHKQYLNNIGNLILTEFNGEIGNKSFADKKEKLNTSSLNFRLYIVNRSSWNEADIKAHGVKMINWFLNAFPLPENMKTTNNWNTAVTEKVSFSPLDDEAGEISEGNKPARLIIGNVSISVKSWQDVFVEFLKWVKNSKDHDFDSILTNQEKLFNKGKTIVKWKHLKEIMDEQIELRQRYKTFEGHFWDSKNTELTDDLIFIQVNSSAKSFMNKIANVMTQLGMPENSVEIVLK